MKNGEMKIRPYAAMICDIFEDLLEEHDITIPDKGREGAEGEARLYGDAYIDLEQRIGIIIMQAVNERSRYDDCNVDMENY